MDKNIQLKLARLPKALGDLAHSNQFLKISALVSYCFCLLMMGLAFYQSSKPPVVLPLAPDGSVYQIVGPPKPENEIMTAVREYIERRYKWEPQTVVKKLAQSEVFVLPQSRKAFEMATANVVKFSVEKAVSQRVYPDKIMVSLEKKTVAISGDRFTAIQGLRAAGELKLELTFESGPRTAQNPWGVYITKEREE